MNDILKINKVTATFDEGELLLLQMAVEQRLLQINSNSTFGKDHAKLLTKLEQI